MKENREQKIKIAKENENAKETKKERKRGGRERMKERETEKQRKKRRENEREQRALVRCKQTIITLTRGGLPLTAYSQWALLLLPEEAAEIGKDGRKIEYDDSDEEGNGDDDDNDDVEARKVLRREGGSEGGGGEMVEVEKDVPREREEGGNAAVEDGDMAKEGGKLLEAEEESTLGRAAENVGMRGGGGKEAAWGSI